MEGIIKEKENTDDWVKSAPVINNLKIDNSNLLPKDVVKKVREVFKI
jgi:hypothetical protein